MRTPLFVLALVLLVGGEARLASADPAPAPGSAPASQPGSQPSPVSVASRFSVSGFVDLYYDFNFNRPADGGNFLPGIGTTGKRANEFSLNLAEVALSLAPDPSLPVGADLVLVYGTGPDIEHGGEPAGEGVGPDVWRFVQRASITYKQGDLTIQGGIMPSHVGFEAFASRDNWTYTRGWLGEYSPYYETGVMLGYAFADDFSAQLYVLNGWQLIGDNNEAKTIGTQLAWSDDDLSLSFNTLLGPETPGDNDHWRFFGDLVATLKLGARLSVATEIDAGLQQRAGAESASWQGFGLYAHFAITPAVAVALRGEIWHDPDAVIAAVGQTVGNGTVCVEWRPFADALILKLEGRYDRADQALFAEYDVQANGTPVLGKDETLISLGAVAAF